MSVARFAALMGALLLTGTAPLAAQDCPSPAQPAGRVAAVDGFGDLVLEDGRVLRLAGLAVPADALGAGEAAYRAALAKLVGQAPRLAVIGARPDRFGRLAVRLAVAGADEAAASLPVTSINERLLSQGLAVVRPEPGLGACLPTLLAAEAPARQARRGLWADLPVPARDVARLSAQEGRFTILAGRVLSVGKGRAVDYLNFGPVWRNDATVRLTKPARAALEAAGTSPDGLAGALILARGVVHTAGGPAITVEEAGQIARLDEWDGKRAGTW
ncbi:thermonuclease family protein [Ancylobacter sp. WKF20]|uniref:thermonuclease family protein n=1 Tax=Ancylobacter sp. WKF20 TaxID=3039801 RepID=UPI0024341421|nr:thermonuclease family protein [Ancylobacter sp. WKF20]WGD29074.1 thermonuclease family protein [Ancylobacter sp. WKF20]